jgi:hypothetical protein
MGITINVEEKAKEWADLLVSTNGTWATVSIGELLREHLIRGYLLGYQEAKHDEKLEVINGKAA